MESFSPDYNPLNEELLDFRAGLQRLLSQCQSITLLQYNNHEKTSNGNDEDLNRIIEGVNSLNIHYLNDDITTPPGRAGWMNALLSYYNRCQIASNFSSSTAMDHRMLCDVLRDEQILVTQLEQQLDNVETIFESNFESIECLRKPCSTIDSDIYMSSTPNILNDFLNNDNSELNKSTLNDNLLIQCLTLESYEAEQYKLEALQLKLLSDIHAEEVNFMSQFFANNVNKDVSSFIDSSIKNENHQVIKSNQNIKSNRRLPHQRGLRRRGLG